MAGKTLDIEHFLKPDQLACKLSETYIQWELRRQDWISEKLEIQQYIFATDTSKTSNAKLPWSNKTTIPKLCQIRDNLYANYMAALFPRKKWVSWEGLTQADEALDKRQAIESYMIWATDRNRFYDEVGKLVLDYIDYGNCIGTVEWVDETQELPEKGEVKVGYVGPAIKRYAPTDIVCNPTAPNFEQSPKIFWSLMTIGEVEEIINRNSTDDREKEDAEEILKYLKEIRHHVADYTGDIRVKDEIYQISGFDNYRAYLQSNYMELLTFYGDIYDESTGEFKRNRQIIIADRHKIIADRPYVSFFGRPPIYHAGWRMRQDNVWAMGPLDNLVGMQYRIDHLENMKADVFDLIAYPPVKVKGYVEDFEWGPFERIYIGDDGEVEVMSPDVQALNADNQIALLEMKMEEMAGSPKEAMGFRTPGEKTAYEVQRLENAAARIFQNKVAQFERQILEPLLNAMLELARRNMNESTIRIFDDELDIATFQSLTVQDITGNGRIKPIAARNFAEKATQLQNLQGLYTSVLTVDPMVLQHISSVETAKLLSDLLDMGNRQIVQPYIRLAEQAEAQTFANLHMERMAMDTMEPSGLFPEDSDESFTQGGA